MEAVYILHKRYMITSGLELMIKIVFITVPPVILLYQRHFLSVTCSTEYVLFIFYSFSFCLVFCCQRLAHCIFIAVKLCSREKIQINV